MLCKDNISLSIVTKVRSYLFYTSKNPKLKRQTDIDISKLI